MDQRSKSKAAQPLPPEDRHALAAFVERVGEQGTLDALGIGRPALARALGGLGIRRGTAVLIRLGLANQGNKR
jgi:hypothetical protein